MMERGSYTGDFHPISSRPCRAYTSEFSRLSLPQTAFGAGLVPDSRRFGEDIMTAEITYTDRLVTITKDDIIFQHYYFPTGKRKVVKIDNIRCIFVEKPTLWNGKWRLHGTGNFKTWFPKDYSRFKRDRIFIATLKNQWVNIGFTVEDGDRVEVILRSKNLIKLK
jgi:hypothetical protein